MLAALALLGAAAAAPLALRRQTAGEWYTIADALGTDDVPARKIPRDLAANVAQTTRTLDQLTTVNNHLLAEDDPDHEWTAFKLSSWVTVGIEDALPCAVMSPTGFRVVIECASPDDADALVVLCAQLADELPFLVVQAVRSAVVLVVHPYSLLGQGVYITNSGQRRHDDNDDAGTAPGFHEPDITVGGRDDDTPESEVVVSETVPGGFTPVDYDDDGDDDDTDDDGEGYGYEDDDGEDY